MQLFRLALPTMSIHPILGLLFFASLLSATQHARAENDQLKKLMLANNCMACHQIDKRKYGPNFVEVAAKYGNSSSAVTKLSAKIKVGGTGVWGEDMMPPQPQVSDAEAKILAELILSLTPKDGL
jgi:cytochrome c